MTITFSMIPTFFISIFMLMGMSANNILDIRIDAVILIAISISTACISRFLPIGKFLSAFLLGMCIHTESESMHIHGTNGHALRMKGIAKGIIQELTQKSNFTYCILEGYIDTPQLPRIETCRILLHFKALPLELKEGMSIQVRGIASNPETAELKGEFNQLSFLKSKKVQFYFSVKETSIIQSDNYDMISPIGFIREWITIALTRLFPNESLPLAKGILLGETSEISSDLRNAFVLLGTAHILSVSGFHAGIIAMMILFCLSWIPSITIKNLLLNFSLIVFLEIVHWDPPAVRACMMTSLAYLIFSLQRKSHSLHILLTVGGFMICLDPTLLSSIGFQMSMVGMFGIIFLPQYLHGFHEILFPKSIAYSLSTSLSAIIMLLPLTAWYFEIISFIAPIANLVFIPIFTIALCWSIIALICFTFSMYLAELFAMSAHQAISLANELHILISKSDLIAYKGEFAFWISCLIIISILMIYSSKNRIQFLISAICSMICIMGMKDLHDQMSAKPQDHFHLYRRKDILAGMAGKNILLLDRDRMRFNGNDKALIQYIVKYYNKSTLIYSGKAAKNIASSIQAVDSTFCMKEYNRETIKLCLNVLDKTIASGE